MPQLTIYKYPIDMANVDKDNHVLVDMPRGASPISVANQRGTLVVYAVVDQGEKKVAARRFLVSGTGHSLPPRPAGTGFPLGNFLGTVLFEALVYHVWDRG